MGPHGIYDALWIPRCARHPWNPCSTHVLHIMETRGGHTLPCWIEEPLPWHRPRRRGSGAMDAVSPANSGRRPANSGRGVPAHSGPANSGWGVHTHTRRRSSQQRRPANGGVQPTGWCQGNRGWGGAQPTAVGAFQPTAASSQQRLGVLATAVGAFQPTVAPSHSRI